MKEIRITARDQGQRMDKYLIRYLPGAGKGFLYKMMRKKNIVLNGRRAGGQELLKEGDAIRLFFSDETLEKFMAGGGKPRTALPALSRHAVLYEDGQVLAVNKPAGMLSQKARPEDVSLVEYITGYLLESGAVEQAELQSFHPGIANRLDRNTSGIILAGKTMAAAQELARIFRERTMEKYYLALVKGVVAQPERCRGYLQKDEIRNQAQISRDPVPGASFIETAWEPLASNSHMTLLKVELITGRSHQIRSHLASLGHPLAGDRKYGEEVWNRKLAERFGLQRQFLHAWKLCFPELAGTLQGLSGKTILAPLPRELEKILITFNMQEAINDGKGR